MIYYIPSFCGDFRIEPDPEAPAERTRLSVVTPTALERVALQKLETLFVKRGWTEASKLADRESTVLVAPMATVAASAAKLLGASVSGSLTALRMGDGKVSVQQDLEGDQLASWLKKAAEKEVMGGDREKATAVTVRQPRLGCPDCDGKKERDRAACDVLWAFLDDEQRASWRLRRAFVAQGNHTGSRFFVMARDTEMAKKNRRVAMHMDGVDRGRPLCIYDPTLPPEEEVLAVKLHLEHRERWVA